MIHTHLDQSGIAYQMVRAFLLRGLHARGVYKGLRGEITNSTFLHQGFSTNPVTKSLQFMTLPTFLDSEAG
jgi:hypothetical protein